MSSYATLKMLGTSPVQYLEKLVYRKQYEEKSSVYCTLLISERRKGGGETEGGREREGRRLRVLLTVCMHSML